MIKRYWQWRQQARVLDEARHLVKESSRRLRKYSHRITPEHAAEIRAASDSLSRAMDKRDFARLPDALERLDKKLEDYLLFGRKSNARVSSEQIAIAVFIALFLRAFVVEAYKIPSGSMIPTLEVGDRIFVNKLIYGVRIPFAGIKVGMNVHKPDRGEVIVFMYPRDPSIDYIKRVVAVEGDTVEVRADMVYVNDMPVEKVPAARDCQYEDYEASSDTWENRRCDGFYESINGNRYLTLYRPKDAMESDRAYGPFTVPKDSVFVMGDNRDNSSDSRVWGPVPLENVRGKAMVVWWSMGKIGDGVNGVFEAVRWKRLLHLVN